MIAYIAVPHPGTYHIVELESDTKRRLDQAWGRATGQLAGKNDTNVFLAEWTDAPINSEAPETAAAKRFSENVRWLVARVKALLAEQQLDKKERDALILELGAWKQEAREGRNQHYSERAALLEELENSRIHVGTLASTIVRTRRKLVALLEVARVVADIGRPDPRVAYPDSNCRLCGAGLPRHDAACVVLKARALVGLP